MPTSTDLLVIGGGPAGLNAAINAASEGLKVVIIDDGDKPGGQARESNSIENYAGFPDGITGDELMSRMVLQATKFGVTFICPARAAKIARVDGHIIVMTEDYQTISADVVVLSIGLQYRRLQANGLGQLLGRGVYYGMPPFAIPKGKRCLVAIIGGANSAGQAVIRVAENPKAQVHMFIRKTINTQMSTYLIERIRGTPNITVFEHAEVTEVNGRSWLKSLVYKQGDKTETLSMDNMFIFIGAMPRTLWLTGQVELDKDNYIKTGGGVVRPVDNPERAPMHYETSMIGVFAAGDARAYATKRISAAVGEGAAVVQQVHQYLATREGLPDEVPPLT